MVSFKNGIWGAVRLALVLSSLPLAGCMDGSSDSADGTSNTATISGTVSPGAASLVLTGAPATDVTSGMVYSFQPAVSGTTSGTVVYTITGMPSWLSLDANSGALTGRPTDAQIGTSGDIVITATAASATGNIGPFRITVKSAAVIATGNTAPTISGTPAATAPLNQAYSFAPTANDADGNPLSFSIVNRPSWASFDTTTGKLSGTPVSGSEGVYANILVHVSDGTTTVALPAFSITVQSAASASNGAPTIAGTPTTTVRAGVLYTFTPSATDPNGDTLVYSVQNLPTWASFSNVTGQINGSPAAKDVGSYSNVTVSVTDGKNVASLPAFRIDVTATVTQTGSGEAVLSWTPPQQNTDGSSLTDLVGYHIRWGMDANNPTQFLDMSWGGYLWMKATNLTPGVWYFSIRSYNSAGVESDPIIVSKTII